MRTFTAFTGHSRLANGAIETVAEAARSYALRGKVETLLVFDDTNGQVIDLDLRGTTDEVRGRLTRHPLLAPTIRKRGRPKLGVLSREVSLLPRHWDWLKAQNSSTSATLRKVVEKAMKEASGSKFSEAGRDAAYAVMSALGGNLEDYEEVCRALFADDLETVSKLVGYWPDDVADYVLELGRGG
ncbi:MAG: hypothetical protein ACJAYU_001404 [Bradymonadia bacterium]|jgi:hypothetical protein